jgi:YidC/Oxa1 family membrane protein insertase
MPYAEGLAIVAITAFVKAATLPLTKKQVESSLATSKLQPKVKELRSRYASDSRQAQQAVSHLYKRAGVNPALDSLLPLTVTLPVSLALYRALSNAAAKGEFGEPFLWVPSLAGPGTLTSDGGGRVQVGISWLLPLDPSTREPPIGWSSAVPYLVLPAILVATQLGASTLLSASTGTTAQSEANTANTDKSRAIGTSESKQAQPPAQQQAIRSLTYLLPFALGYISLTVPSGLTLYWISNNVFTTLMTYYLRYLGGAKTPVTDDDLAEGTIRPGTALRTGPSEHPGPSELIDGPAAPVKQDRRQIMVAKRSKRQKTTSSKDLQ